MRVPNWGAPDRKVDRKGAFVLTAIYARGKPVPGAPGFCGSGLEPAKGPRHMRKPKRGFRSVCMVCAFALFSLTRLININRSLWTDEANQVLDSMRPLRDVAFAAARQTLMPLDFWTIHFSTGILGHNAFGYRFSALLFSHLTALVVFLFVRRICRSIWPALLALVILSSNGPYLRFSQEVRPYSLCIFSIIWMTYLGFFHFRRPRQWGLCAMAACCFLGFLGHGFFVFVFPALFAAGGCRFLFSVVRRRRSLSGIRRSMGILFPLGIAFLSFCMARPTLARLLLFAQDMGHLINRAHDGTLAGRMEHVIGNFNVDGVLDAISWCAQPLFPFVPAVVLAASLVLAFCGGGRPRRREISAAALMAGLGLNLLTQDLVLIDAGPPVFSRYFFVHYGVYVVAYSVALWSIVRRLGSIFLRILPASAFRVAPHRLRMGVSCAFAVAVCLCYLAEGAKSWSAFYRSPAKEDLAGAAEYIDKRAGAFDEIHFFPAWRGIPIQVYRSYALKSLCRPRSEVVWHVQYTSSDPAPEGMILVKRLPGLAIWRSGPEPMEPGRLKEVFPGKVNGEGTYILFGVPRSPVLRKELCGALIAPKRAVLFAEDAVDSDFERQAFWFVWTGRDLRDRTEQGAALMRRYKSELPLLLEANRRLAAPPEVQAHHSKEILPDGSLRIVSSGKPYTLCLSRDLHVPASIVQAVCLEFGYFPRNPERAYSDTWRRFALTWTTDHESAGSRGTQQSFLIGKTGRMESVSVNLRHLPGEPLVQTLSLSPYHTPGERDEVIFRRCTLLGKSAAQYLASNIPL